MFRGIPDEKKRDLYIKNILNKTNEYSIKYLRELKIFDLYMLQQKILGVI